ncbi:ABC transporter ATP-binding protein [Streptococcus dysgalactiae subsp. equisimilis]|uniref:ABC transporter ATP-binding protein n=1 Tax=Streptococcus dysgalactiae TaxID=1334 RepID=UPI000A0FD6CF|nr:ABC transporter ATP-binding protein [Streptococcus dysgalactiae]MCY7195833.1 ABC transporter ATP-binding protein [Streptococcus dysgalactiae]MCY7200233.1 ABC transporter ATP-binding protein [Streptococcus dysgalactiae]MCY7207106.1 ABC transporter ATP-binding protein [Streptococcus dysgalactiae]MCY7216401.1 ABC transporter ATP-binding protein [Streptococcus dysgalactiae]ORJ90682.1 ABC transporter ATP-binding protein [Streptococcus dysgalactiae subsp. equisimilis]
MTAISLQNLSKSFGDKVILDQVSLELEENKIYGFVGPNGTGKTTTIKMILGLVKVDSGQISVMGTPVTFGQTKSNQAIGYLPDVPEFYDYMTAEEYLQLCAGLAQNQTSLPIADLLAQVGLSENKQRISTYSRGMKQRLGLAQALIHNPKILICDEPTSALDPQGRQDILSIITQLRGQKTVIFSTHILSEVEKVCDQVLILTKAGIHNLEELRDKAPTSKNQLNLLIKVSETEAQKLALQFPLSKKDQYYKVHLELSQEYSRQQAMGRFYRYLVEQEITPSFIELLEDSLEDLYLEVIK